MQFAKKIIQTTQFWEIEYINDLKTLYVTWKEEAEKISEEFFKKHLTDFVAVIQKLQPTSFLVDSTNGHIVMNLDLQDWHDNHIVPKYIENGIKKIAFVVSDKDFVVQVSIEQAFEEEKASALTCRFFDKQDEAFTWIAL